MQFQYRPSPTAPWRLVDTEQALALAVEAVRTAHPCYVARDGTPACIDSPQSARLLLRAAFAPLDPLVEHFGVLLLDGAHNVIGTELLFHGTLTCTSVYPRELVRLALTRGASALVLAHNHPSGSLEPSRADEHLTATLKQAGALVDVRILDHVIIAGDRTLSFAERGLI
jgi:DNA repair protein RadC